MAPQPGIPAPENTEALQFHRRNAAAPLEAVDQVYAGETLPLELSGVGADETALWFSMDTRLGVFRRPGELHLLRAGQLIVEARAGDRSVSLTIQIGDQRPPPPEDPPVNPPDTETPEPSALPSPAPTPTPTATPSATATPQPSATPEASPLPTPEASPSPSPTPPANETPLPTPVASDPFVDQVVTFTPGPSAGFGSSEFPGNVLGPPQGGGLQQGGFDVLSLGIGGTIVLSSETAILNGSGPDFIVFENAFYAGGNPLAPFAEPGEVAVSQDGMQFFSFPCASGNREELYPGCAGVHPVLANAELNGIDPTDPQTAGGDAFDLNLLGLPWVRYIRIRDLSGSGGGNSAGFDLDAISIIHQ